MTTRSIPPEAGPKPIESVQRVVQVLRLFLEADADEGLTVTATARRLDVAKSTASRLLATLASEGLVTMDPETRRYHVGVLAFRVGSRLRATRMAGTVKPIIQRLAESTGHTTQIGTLHDTKVLYLAVAESVTRLRVVAAPGDLRDAHTSAMGKAILAGLGNAAVDDLIRDLAGADGKLPQTGPGTITDPQALHDELRLTASRGYSISREEATAGVSAIGVGVAGPLPIPLAVSIAFPSGIGQEEETLLVGKVQDASRDILEALLPGSSDETNMKGGSS